MPKFTCLGSRSGTEPVPGRHHTAFVLTENGVHYWFDAGENCAQTAYLKGIDMLKIKAVFISHPHMDHVAGLGGLLWTIAKVSTFLLHKNPLDDCVRIFTPSLKTVQGTLDVLAESDRKYNPPYEIRPVLYKDGLVYEDENIQVTAYHNHHLIGDGEDNIWHSFTFRILLGGRKIVYTGDFREYSELDETIGEGCDVLLLETGHHFVNDIRAYCDTKNIGKLVYLHHGREILFNHNDALGRIDRLWNGEAVVCDDGTEISL